VLTECHTLLMGSRCWVEGPELCRLVNKSSPANLPSLGLCAQEREVSEFKHSLCARH
jgi:hypothetical protein